MGELRYVMQSTLTLTNIDWFSTYVALAKDVEHHILLESGQRGRYSFIGIDPFAILKGKDRCLTVETNKGSEVYEGDLLTMMKQWLQPYEVVAKSGELPFQGGAIGFFSYDIVRQYEDLPNVALDDLDTYDLYFYIFNELFVIDHEKNELHICAHYVAGEEEAARERLKRAELRWKLASKAPKQKPFRSARRVSSVRKSSLSKKDFIAAVETIRESIRKGELFQVNLTVRQEEVLITEPLHIYEKLRDINPSPYMAYMHSPELQIVSGSPELLVKKRGTTVWTRPIAGTRSRGKDQAEDETLANTLRENEKERAEHMMLVDLERNDLGRVCEYGSIEVDEWLVIEKYSHVMHIVSSVRGELAKQYDNYDLIRAMFPGGTITGAPKRKTMDMIERLERVRRGIYTGSIGWIGFNGQLEFNIVIRTLIAKNGKAYVQAGAGIVVDSNAQAEYEESLKKAAALWRAKQLSEEEARTWKEE